MSATQSPTKSDACPFNAAEQKQEVVIEEKPACPFSKGGDDNKDMMNQASVKLNTLNSLLPETQQKKNQEYLSDPQLASAMKEGTKVVHTAAENSLFTKRFLAGTINQDEYGRYINSLYFVYKNLEALLVQHKDHPTVQMIHFPFELTREKALLQDLEYYFGKDRLAEITDEKNITPAVATYVKSLKDAAEKNPALLVAHSYSRYLGDLSGGQILAKRLKKHVLKIDVTDAAWDSYEGLQFYNFDHIANHHEFKNLYRQRLDGALVSQYTKDLIVAEAIYSFELNIGLFDEIQELSDANKLTPTLKERGIAGAETKNTGFKYAPSTDLLVGFASGALALAVGFTVYQRYVERL